MSTTGATTVGATTIGATTIDVGIDLGTTNSAIALAAGADATVVRNTWQREFTPSAVFVSGAGKIYVGEEAKGRLERDPDNAVGEFKLQMGTDNARKTFLAAGRSMTPAELSAEVLKSLRADVQRATGADVTAAVITVPAAFELDQCDATRRAAELAGLAYAPLIQEPTAAAWAHSTVASADRAFWLVYDFGGGTFDAAVVNVRDGEFTVVNHAGDNFLGGKLIDWALVEEVLVPAVRDAYGLAELGRTNRRWAGNIAKLKHAAELAKIQLSAGPTAEVRVELEDAAGKQVEFEHEITRADLERFTEPLYARSIMLCRRALAEKGLAPGDVERVLLVGGTTLAPGLRERLADPRDGLGIPLDHSLDAITVVARGAAIFAGTQRVPRAAGAGPSAAGSGVHLELEHKAAGPDTEPLVGGRATGTPPGTDWTGCTVEFSNAAAQPPWRSGQVEVAANGAFVTRLRAQERAANTYAIEFRDPRGTLLATEPATLTYRHAPLVGGAAVLTHSVGVGLSHADVRWLLEKGTELPAHRRVVLRTTVDVRKGSGKGLIRVPLVEGERPRADRNTLIGRLEVRPTHVKRDVPAGSEVEISVEVDASRTVRAEAYVPLLDAEFAIDVELGRAQAPPVSTLRATLAEVADRAHSLRARVADLPVGEAVSALDRLYAEGVLEEAGRLLRAAEADPDAAWTCHSRLLDGQTILDDVESSLELPALMERVRKLRENVARKLQQSSTPADLADFQAADAAADAALRARDKAVLRRQADAMLEIGMRALRRTGRIEALIFEDLRRRIARIPELAGEPVIQKLVARGRTDVDHRDHDDLAKVNAELRRRLPADAQGSPDWFSTVDER